MKSSRYWCALLVVLSVASPAHAQSGTVAGIVIDDRTEQPISGVTVYAENQSTVAETDADGRFKLSVPSGRRTIVASVIGYALVTTDIDVRTAPVDVTIRLSEGAARYTDRVTVSASAGGESDSVPGATSFYGRGLENLRGAVLDDPLRAIQALPSATANDDFYSEFAVRGNPFHYVGMVVDGVPTRYLLHSVNGVPEGGSIAMINSDTLGSVSLLPGSYPQRTGRHMGAEIDLATRDGSRDGFHGRAGLSGTSAEARGEGPITARGSWLLSMRRSYLDYLVKRLDPGAGFAFGFVDAQAKAMYDVSARHQVSATVLLGRSKFADDDPRIGVNELREAISRSWLMSLSWRYLPSTRFTVTQRLFSTGLRYDNDNRDGATLDSARSTELGWRVDASFSPSPRLVFEFGGDAQLLTGRRAIRFKLPDSSSLAELSDYDERAGAGSAYGQGRFGLGSRLTVTPGARVDLWALTGSTTASPWVNAEIRLSKRTRLLGGSGIYRQFADLDTVFGIQGGGRDLQPERALHVDAGVEHALGHQMHVRFNLYARHERDVLWTRGAEPHPTPAGTISQRSFTAPWVNALRGNARGAEIVVRRDTAAGFSGWAGYAYGHLRYTDTLTGERFWGDADQRHTLSLYGHYRLSNRTSLSSRYRYGSNYPMVGYIGEPSPALGQRPLIDGRPLFFGLTEERNTLRLPAYSRLDARADRAFNWWGQRLVLFVDVANVLNRTNVRNANYFVDRTGRVLETTESLMPIVPSGGVMIEF